MKSSEKVLIALLAFKRTTGLVLILAVILAIPVTLALNQKPQSLRQDAAEIKPTPQDQTNNPQVIQTNIDVDVNSDGAINITDYNMILRCTDTQSICEISTTDLNNDGILNTEDYKLMLDEYFKTQPLY